MNQSLIPYRANDLSSYMRMLSDYPLLSREEEEALAYRFYEDGDREAAQQLVTAHLRFVVKVAFEFKRSGLPMMDLIQEGNLGLMEAVRRYDPTKGYRLITYAVWYIRMHIQRYVVEMWSIVRRGTTRAQRKLFYNLSKTRNEMEQDSGRPMSNEELAEALGVEVSDVEEMQLMMSAKDVSLDAPVQDDQQQSYVDFLVDTGQSQEEKVIEVERHDEVASAVETVRGVLSDRDREILDRRLIAEDPATLEELSQSFNISRERVRQLESNIKSKIKGLLTANMDPE